MGRKVKGKEGKSRVVENLNPLINIYVQVTDQTTSQPVGTQRLECRVFQTSAHSPSSNETSITVRPPTDTASTFLCEFLVVVKQQLALQLMVFQMLPFLHRVPDLNVL